MENIVKKFDLIYYTNLKNYIIKNNLYDNNKWIDISINQTRNNIDNIENSDTLTNKDSEVQNEIVEYDINLYKKPWNKLNIIHKILKIKEYINNLNINDSIEKNNLIDQLVNLIKKKELTKKKKILYNKKKKKKNKKNN